MRNICNIGCPPVHGREIIHSFFTENWLKSRIPAVDRILIATGKPATEIHGESIPIKFMLWISFKKKGISMVKNA